MSWEVMEKNDIYCVERLLQYLGDTPSTWVKDKTYEERMKYEGDKTIVLIDADRWANAKAPIEGLEDATWLKKNAVLKTFHNGDHIGGEWRELDIDTFEVEGDNVKAYVFTRRCSVCGALMFEGYCVDNGWEYYCSDECLHKHYTEEEWDEMCCDGEGDSYWTQWY